MLPCTLLARTQRSLPVLQVGDNELLSDAHLKLMEGQHYGLVGRYKEYKTMAVLTIFSPTLRVTSFLAAAESSPKHVRKKM